MKAWRVSGAMESLRSPARNDIFRSSGGCSAVREHAGVTSGCERANERGLVRQIPGSRVSMDRAPRWRDRPLLEWGCPLRIGPWAGPRNPASVVAQPHE